MTALMQWSLIKAVLSPSSNKPSASTSHTELRERNNHQLTAEELHTKHRETKTGTHTPTGTSMIALLYDAKATRLTPHSNTDCYWRCLGLNPTNYPSSVACWQLENIQPHHLDWRVLLDPPTPQQVCSRQQERATVMCSREEITAKTAQIQSYQKCKMAEWEFFSATTA